MSRTNACARDGGVNVCGLSASVPFRAVSASLLVLVAGGTSVLAQGPLPPAPDTTPAVAPLSPAAPDSPALADLAPDSTVMTPTRGFPDAQANEAPRAPTAEPKEDSTVKVDDNLVVDLHVNDEELSNVLQMLSIQSQRNIVASNSVNARVKADLYGVTFYEALDAILHVNGYGYIDRGNFIYVYTLEELQQIEKAARVRVSKVIKLNYLNSIDAAEFVKPLLSDGAQIKTNGKTKDFAINNVPMGADEFAHDATLVVYDYEENLAEIEKLVRELDTRPAQVLIEATILQTQLNEANAFGVDFALIADMNFLDFATVGGPESVVNNLLSGRVAPDDDIGRGIVSTPGNTGGRGTMKVGVIANDVAAFVKLLDETNDTTIISNPKVLALNRAQTRVLVGRKVGYLSTTSTDTTTTQSVEFLDTGTQLTVRPFVSADGMIRMELKPQVSEAVIRDTKDATGAAVTIPDEITNELNTNVMVRDGQTIVLGGLFRESTQASRRQVPFLGDIPILGSAFRGNDDETNRSEIIFLITPSIVNDNVLLSQGEAAKDYVERARAGSREGLLPWSRDKMTSMELVEAQKLAAAGETQKALWKIQQSLTLNPNQPDAIAMRERLTNERSTWPSRNLLDLIIHQEAAHKIGEPKASVEPSFQPPAMLAPPPAPPPVVPQAEASAEPVATSKPLATPEPAATPEPVAAPITDATPSQVDPSETPAATPPFEPEPLMEAPPTPSDPPQPEPQPETPPQKMATLEVSPARPFPVTDSSGAVAQTSTASAQDLEGWHPAWFAPQSAAHAEGTQAVSQAARETVEPQAVQADEAAAARGEVFVQRPQAQGELATAGQPLFEESVDPHAPSAPNTTGTTTDDLRLANDKSSPDLRDSKAVIDPHALATASGTTRAPVQSAQGASNNLVPVERTGHQAAAQTSPAGSATAITPARPLSTSNVNSVARGPSAPATGSHNRLAGGATARSASGTSPPADRSARDLSATSSPQSHNLSVASSDHLKRRSASSTDSAGLPDQSLNKSARAAAPPSGTPGQSSHPPDPGGTGLAEPVGERVASALKVMNFSWRIMRVVRAGSGDSLGGFTQVPETPQDTADR